MEYDTELLQSYVLNLLADGHRDSAKAICDEILQEQPYVAVEAGERYAALWAGDLDEAFAMAKLEVDPANYNQKDDGSMAVTVEVRCLTSCDAEGGFVLLHPDAPPCIDGKDHDWRAPYSIVGGAAENPGVFSIGGVGLSFRTVCAHCGAYQTKRTPTQGMESENDHTTVAYEEADATSIAWSRQKRGVVSLFGEDTSLNAMRRLMDDDLCEAIHGTVDNDQDFLDAYLTAHEAKYGEPFCFS
jgi:hypothetical protein